MSKNTKTQPIKKAPTKAHRVEELLRSRNGASIQQIADATGWQVHSCRAFLTGLRKKDLSLTRASRKDGTTFYRLASGKTAKTAEASKRQASEKTDA